MQIEDVLKELGIDYRVTGREASAPCPFHIPDKHPSWSVNLTNGVHHCFSCGASGSLAHLVSHIRKISYIEATIYINEKIGWAKAGRWREDYESQSISPPSFKVSEADLAVFSDPPQEALAGRNLTLNSAKVFGVRYEANTSSWIIPIRDPYSDELWGWQAKNGRCFRNFPRGIRKSKTLFGMGAFANGSTAVLVESPLDVVRLHAASIRSGLASFGVSVSDSQFSLIHGSTERLVLALDNDRDGIRETNRIAEEFRQCSKISVLNYSHVKVKDVGEMTDQEIHWAIDNAMSVLKWRASVHR